MEETSSYAIQGQLPDFSAVVGTPDACLIANTVLSRLYGCACAEAMRSRVPRVAVLRFPGTNCLCLLMDRSFEPPGRYAIKCIVRSSYANHMQRVVPYPQMPAAISWE